MVLVTGTFLLYAIRAERVDTDVVSAALCAYFLIGATFGLLYTVVESVSPGSFIVNVATPSSTSDAANSSILLTLQRADFVYFSLVAMTSAGFGDILPVSRMARALTVVEVLVGQLYLVVMIARLVSHWHQPSQAR
ncbi:MAG: ion channel [Nitrospiraceae bacterium]